MVLTVEEFEALVREVAKLLGWEVAYPLDSVGSVARLHGDREAVDCYVPVGSGGPEDGVTITIGMDSHIAEHSAGRLIITGFCPDQQITVWQSRSAAEIVCALERRLLPFYVKAAKEAEERAYKLNVGDILWERRNETINTLNNRLHAQGFPVCAVISNAGDEPELHLYLDDNKAWAKYLEMFEQRCIDNGDSYLSVEEVRVRL